MWENALSGKLNAGVFTGKVTMAAASFQLGWPKRNVFIEGGVGRKERERLRQDVNNL